MNIRTDALKAANDRFHDWSFMNEEGAEDAQISSYFGNYVFDDHKMQQYLSADVYLLMRNAIDKGEKLDLSLAKDIAEAMRQWAMDHGATHFAHWFQPLTGKTAEKHDSFFTLDSNGGAIEEFGGRELAQQEPDGSSFPGGGLRSTFEARGYTAWDPSSPAFILETASCKTLCIPTIFVTYGGEALDYKLPLLKSKAYLESAAVQVMEFFADDVTKVVTTLGWEQEYFLVDEAFFNARPDLLLAGRTVIGQYSAKGQQLDDHYFGSIPDRVLGYMRDLEKECHLLGIPVRTRHNEVGPGQYELAPMYEEVNVAIDHNQLLMDVMDRVARRHHLRVLLHEKPFDGVNGSGKHNNWSMATNTGINLLSPGKDPGNNLRFLTFFVNTIMAVYRYADLLRASVASASNDHRLGANEAPPAIVSIFIGEALTKVLDAIEHNQDLDDEGFDSVMDLVRQIPFLKKDNTDRNRTSPFAFTGNKFEIRMVGSTMNCAAPMTIMNTIVGLQLRDFMSDVQQRVDDGTSQERAILSVLRTYIIDSKAILFEGDGYSEEWEQEAARRGLGNAKNTPAAIKAFLTEKAQQLFTSTGVLSKDELHAHYEVRVESYILNVQIEARVLGELWSNFVLPAAINYQKEISENIAALRNIGLPESSYQAQLHLIERLNKHIQSAYSLVGEMINHRKMANQVDDAEERARLYCDEITSRMETIRDHIDKIERIVDDAQWPLIKYREMMFLR